MSSSKISILSECTAVLAGSDGAVLSVEWVLAFSDFAGLVSDQGGLAHLPIGNAQPLCTARLSPLST